MISVVVPVFNAGELICRSIESVLNQPYDDYELIVINDGSTDQTEDYVNKYKHKIRYRRQNNQGISGATNIGIKMAKGTWIALLDADDEWLPQKLELQTALLKQYPDLVWCASNFFHTDGNISLPASSNLAKKDQERFRYYDNFFQADVSNGLQFHTSTMMIKKQVFQTIGWFETAHKRNQDWDMWWRIAYQHPAIGFVTKPLAIHHHETVMFGDVAERLKDVNASSKRELIRHHLPLAAEAGYFQDFKQLASRELTSSIKEQLFLGLTNDAKRTIETFPELISPNWQLMVTICSIWPQVSSWCIRGLTQIRRVVFGQGLVIHHQTKLKQLAK
jgi:glycosyltransferase involved in cell wall biosynthesis